MEPLSAKRQLKYDVEKRLYSSEKSEITYFTKNETSLKSVIYVIKERLRLPGIVARGPRFLSRPNLHLEFPAVLNSLQPEMVIKHAISINAEFDCEPQIQTV